MAGVGFGVLFVYFLPPIVAFARGHRSAFAILVLTILLGWTGLGWIVAIVWSFTGNTRGNAMAPVIVNVSQVVNAPSTPVLVAPAPSAPLASFAGDGIASLQAQLKQWTDEIEDIRRRRPPDGVQRLETINHLVTGARADIRHARSETPLGPPLASPAPPLSQPGETPLQQQMSKDGRPYYRNEIPPTLPEYPSIYGRAFFDQLVVGAAHYQDELDRIAGGRRDAPVFFRTNALVYADDADPHDGTAVAIDIAGLRVGYIAREDAPAFRAELAEIGGAGAFCVRALIENGWPDWRVKLDADRPLRLR